MSNLGKIVEKMLNTEVEKNKTFPTFFAVHEFGRGLFSERKELPHIVASHGITIWKVTDDKLIKTNHKNTLFDGENYLIEWNYDYVMHAGAEINSEVFFFHWKGMNALKGVSPLPTGRNIQNVLVDRIYHWSEPPIFFQIFSEKLFVLNGKEDEFNCNIMHLFMVRGELAHEKHLYELPCSWENFRSKAILLLVVPDRKTVYIWFGSQTDQKVVKLYTDIKNIHSSWLNFEINTVIEGRDKFVKELLLNTGEYNIVKDIQIPYTPKLFYVHFQEGKMSAVQINYPLIAPDVVAPFPFLKTHLYTAPQPAFFILDNYYEVWLWKNLGKSDSDVKTTTDKCSFVEALLINYVEKLRQFLGRPITINYTNAGEEPVQFTNIFPYWKI